MLSRSTYSSSTFHILFCVSVFTLSRDFLLRFRHVVSLMLKTIHCVGSERPCTYPYHRTFIFALVSVIFSTLWHSSFRHSVSSICHFLSIRPSLWSISLVLLFHPFGVFVSAISFLVSAIFALVSIAFSSFGSRSSSLRSSPISRLGCRRLCVVFAIHFQSSPSLSGLRLVILGSILGRLEGIFFPSQTSFRDSVHYVTGFSCRSGYCSLALFLSTFPSISSFISFNIFSFRHLQLFFPHPLKFSVFPTRFSTLYSVVFHAFRHLGSLFLSVHSFPLSFSRLCVLSSSHLRFPSSFPASFQSSLLLICVSIVVLEF